MKRIYIDENLPEQLANGLNKIDHFNQIEVLSIKQVFGEGVADEEWIPLLGNEKAVVITSDINIKRRKEQCSLLKHHKVGLFVVSNNATYWVKVKWIIQNWEEIRKLALKKKPPYMYKIMKSGIPKEQKI